MQHLTPEDYAIAEKNGITQKHAYQRYYFYGWDREKSITQPVRKRGASTYKQWKAVAESNDITISNFYMRIKLGMTPEQAATKPLNKQMSARYVNRRGDTK